MPTIRLFELMIATLLAVIALHFAPRKLGLPPAVALIAGGALLAFLPGLVLKAVAAGRAELIRLHRAGDIDEETLHELERDLDLEELGAISAMA